MALIKTADHPAVREWTESLWGTGGPWTRPVAIDETLPSIPVDQRAAARVPSAADKAALVARDGHHRRFRGIPLVRDEVRKRMAAAYPSVLPWGTTNASQHAGLQALWLHYNLIIPHSHEKHRSPGRPASPPARDDDPAQKPQSRRTATTRTRCRRTRLWHG